MWCSELELEDWCLPPSHPDAIVTHHALDTFKRYLGRKVFTQTCVHVCGVGVCGVCVGGWGCGMCVGVCDDTLCSNCRNCFQ